MVGRKLGGNTVIRNGREWTVLGKERTTAVRTERESMVVGIER